ncbi:HD domain-containing protein [Vibrio sp. DNF-1]|nr:HD domain-containing protein [Vibrio salinus]MCE0495013.1 HD domain-containing protein [Vibrio salinus]
MHHNPAHDINHVLRVVKTARALCSREKAVKEIVIPAAYLHDCVSLDKNHPGKHLSSALAARKAVQFLKQLNYPPEYLDGIYHAIEAHSYSANIKAKTLEAKIIQDADRLDALGAIGISRCLQVGSQLNRPLYSHDDPFCLTRGADDNRFTIDHFFSKLLRLKDTMNTESAREEAAVRTRFIESFLKQLKTEINDEYNE